MPEIVSAGILLFRHRAGSLEVLLGHPGGPWSAGTDAGSWSIPKGQPHPAESVETGATDLLAVARREFEEETGHPVPAGALIPLGAVVQKSGKVVHAWAAEGDLDPALASSNTFQMEWPPRSGRVGTFPEIDRVAWFDPAEARRRIRDAQMALIDRLEAALAPKP